MIVAHVSDLHLDGTGPRRERAVRVADHLRALRPSPDVVLVTGDVADHGAPADYAEAASVLDGPAPLAVPGNHDDRDALAAAFGPADRIALRDPSALEGVASTLRSPDEPGEGPVREPSEPGPALHVLRPGRAPLSVFRTPA